MARPVFICHSSLDHDLAFAVCAKLETAGINCWIAPRDPVPGLPYGQQIVHAIAESTIMLLVLSRNSNDSRAVLGEIELAANRSKIILPMRIEDIAPSEGLEYYIRSVHWHDVLAASQEANLDALVARVQGILKAPHEAGAAPPVAKAAGPAAFSAAELTAVTSRLAMYLGPVARVLVARYAQKAANLKDLCDALGAEISDPAERSRFLAEPHETPPLNRKR
jgi:TIR domain